MPSLFPAQEEFPPSTIQREFERILKRTRLVSARFCIVHLLGNLRGKRLEIKGTPTTFETKIEWRKHLSRAALLFTPAIHPTDPYPGYVHGFYAQRKKSQVTPVISAVESVAVPEIMSFGLLMLLKKTEGKYVLLVSAVQKSMLKKYGTDSKRYRVSDPERVVSVDPHQMTHGPTRHYVFITAAMRIAKEMQLRGINVEVHVPHPDSIPPAASPETMSRIRAPFQILDQHFEEDQVPLMQPHKMFRDTDFEEPVVLKTVNLSKPKTQKAIRLLRRLRI